MNPLEIIKTIKNPQEYVLGMMNTNTNPMLKNLVEMAKKGQTKELETFARNMFKEQGKDYDDIMKLFK